ncbi:substrate-binding domain-containing protein [Streptomyces caeruleatus]|uniref:substrate-binding domain-containing protein n=1 Tax=Streptomyces caeruleatus TaxID=661399 RepID=UPI000A8FE313
MLRDITGPSLAHVAAGVEQEAALRGRLSLVCATHGDTEREDDLVQLMREQHVAAVLPVGGAVQDEAYFQRMAEYVRALDAAGSRLVLVGRPSLPGDLPVTVVDYDNRGGAFQAADHLLVQGHRRILFLGGDPQLSTASRRREGFLHALRAHGVEYAEELDIPGPYTRVSGYQRTRDALKRGDFTGIVAGTDMVALGALAALRDQGLDVPGDVSLVGFDDVPFAADLSPWLTSVRVPYEDLGRTAVRLALERGERITSDDHVVLSTQLVIRQSVRRLKAG